MPFADITLILSETAQKIVEATKEFQPFQPYALQAWETILELLDSERIENRWAAAALVERLEPLNDSQVGQLIERLHRNDNRSLEAAIRKQAVNAGHCQDLCDRLCRGEFERGEFTTNRDDYRRIVIQHGSDLQLWQLYEHGEDAERSAAIRGLRVRGRVDDSDPRLHEAAVANLLSTDYGRCVEAKLTFTKSEAAQSWFFANADALSESHRWAVLEAMRSFGADLSPLQDQLFARIAVEDNFVVRAKMIGLIQYFQAVDGKLMDRLMSVVKDDANKHFKAAIAPVLGAWLARPEVREAAVVRLQELCHDDSTHVRCVAMQQFAKDAGEQCINMMRELLRDPDPDIVRHAMWSLADRNSLTEQDLWLLINTKQPDRVSAETWLALAIVPQPQLPENMAEMPTHHGPLTESIRQWSRSKAIPRRP